LLPKDQIIAGESGVAIYNIALALIAVVLFGAGIACFTKKDFSL